MKSVTAIGLDPAAPYSLGNKTYHYARECNSGHKNLQDEEIAFAGGWYDGYHWTVPVCLRCVKANPEYPNPGQHSHNTSVHLIDITESLVARAKESPALKGRHAGYPANWSNDVPLKVMMVKTAKSDLPLFSDSEKALMCEEGQEFYVKVNSYGAVSALFPDGAALGLKPNEFRVTEWH